MSFNVKAMVNLAMHGTLKILASRYLYQMHGMHIANTLNDSPNDNSLSFEADKIIPVPPEQQR